MLRKPALYAIFGAFLCAAELVAQSTQREVVTQAAEWFSLVSTVKVHDRVGWLIEGHGRFVQGMEPQQYQFRTGPEFEINRHWSIIPLGYAYTWNPLYGKQPNHFSNNEHRTFQQVVSKHNISRVSISHRVRLEQRFTQVHTEDNGEVVYHGYDMYTNRMRYKLNVNIPLNKARIEPGTVYVALYEELFKSFGKNVTYQNPDQNRLFAGLGYAFTPHFSMQGGAFYQLLIKSGGAMQENNVGIAVNVNYNFDLTKE